LSAAYAVSQRSASSRAQEAERPMLIELNREELKELRFTGAQVSVSMHLRKDDRKESYIWVTVSREGHPPVSFRGGRYANHVLEGYLPLRAVRELGVLDPTQLKEGGLEQPAESIHISSTSSERELKIGTATVAGEGRRVLDLSSQRVYIVPAHR